MSKVHLSFTAREKIKFIAYAEAHGKHAAGREFCINEANVWPPNFWSDEMMWEKVIQIL